MKLIRSLAGLGTLVLLPTFLPGQNTTSELPSAPGPTAEAIQAYRQRLPAGVTLSAATGGPMRLSLDEAVARTEEQALQVQLARQNDARVRGLQSSTVNALLPTLEAQGYTNTQEINLLAMGFKPQSLGPILQQFGLAESAFSTIVKVDVTSAQLSLSQQLFNITDYYLYKAAKRANAVSNYGLLNARGQAALQVGRQYLAVLADAALIENARAQVAADQVALDQAQQRQAAGVGIHLDTLRAEVQLKTQQQALVSAENTEAKDRIQLNRLMSLPAEQRLTLTDRMPYEELAALPHAETLAFAYTKRKDLLSLEAQLDVAEKTERAVRYERLPTLAMSGYYGVIGETEGLYHGVFAAQGSLNFPIFKEAQFRGEREVAVSQLMGLRQQIASLKVTIDQQIRSNELDVASANEMVKVSHSNVELARQELADSQERFVAGVDDNLPVVQAQGTLAEAENQLVQATLMFNTSKLELARSVGVVDSQFRVYLGR